MSELSSGEALDSRFSLIRPLGHGGMAEVWLVHDRELDEEVAAKIVPAGASEETIALLRRECQNARRLSHPNIVRVFDFHRGEKRSFITMGFVEGEPLAGLRAGDPVEILRLLRPVADALDHAHELGIVHRDLKAENVLRDSGGRPFVLDFGIAAVLAGDDRLEVSGSGSRYAMSPQQLDGAEPEPADDIYAFGVLLYELIGGHPPFWPEITDDRIRAELPEKLFSSYPLPAEVQSLAKRLLAKAAGDRPRNMAEVGAELDAILSGLGQGSAPDKPGKERVRLKPPPRVKSVRPTVPQHRPEPAPRRPAADPQRRQWLITMAVVVPLILVALLVVFVLPGVAEKSRNRTVKSPDAEGVAESLPPPSETVDHAGIADEPITGTLVPTPLELEAQSARKEAARDAFDRATTLCDGLEDRGVLLWAEEEFAAARAILARGDEQLSLGAYADAERIYSEAARTLEALAASGPEILQAALDEGHQALAAGDSAAASAAFDLAATIDPANSAAESGLRRAAALDQVLALLDAGAQSERDGGTEEAERSYRQAVTLDPLSRQAQRALARVQGRISDDAFNRAMSNGLQALEERDYPSARQAFGRAERLRPGRPEVAEALLQVKQGETRDAIVDHRDRAAAAESREDWHAAVEGYAEILKLDPTIRFAGEGKERCAARAEMADRIDYHLANPGRLTTEAVFDEALELYSQAALNQPAGPRHRERMESFRRLLDAAGTPVPVVLVSDLETQVTVYKVGRLGAFDRRELKLRPGSYTVVGSRPGYRDVRLTLVVEAGAPPPPLMVKCEDPI